MCNCQVVVSLPRQIIHPAHQDILRLNGHGMEPSTRVAWVQMADRKGDLREFVHHRSAQIWQWGLLPRRSAQICQWISGSPGSDVRAGDGGAALLLGSGRVALLLIRALHPPGSAEGDFAANHDDRLPHLGWW